MLTWENPVSREQAEAIIVIADEKLLDLTGFGLQLVDFVEDDSGSSIESLVENYLGDGYMYIAVLQFNYRYAACGYAGTDTIQSQVSGYGECRDEEGTACAEWEGMQVCQVALPFLKGHTPIDLAAGPVIHEFMHAFGDKGPDDHYTSEVCRQIMGWEPGHYDLEEAETYSDFCPNVYEMFADSYRP